MRPRGPRTRRAITWSQTSDDTLEDTRARIIAAGESDRLSASEVLEALVFWSSSLTDDHLRDLVRLQRRARRSNMRPVPPTETREP